MIKSDDQWNSSSRIHVETTIAAPLEQVLEATQSPEAHARWDTRFDAIVPLAKRGDWQAFRYETRLGPWLRIHGTGESVLRGRTSVLRFRGAAPSPIRAGAGYWRYEDAPGGGVRFVTAFDYAPPPGLRGAVLDRVLVRRLFARATARSFDRLRRWLDEGVAPESLRGRFGARASRTRWSIGAPR
jgi:hypothetical protein